MSTIHCVPDSIAQCAAEAARRYHVTTGLRQAWLKPVTVLIIDELLRESGATSPDERWLAANCMTADGDRHWAVGACSTFTFEPYEVLVDIHLFAGSNYPYTTLLTAESEGSEPQARRLARMDPPSAADDWQGCDFIWDAWKLLLVPSPVKLFTTIINGPGFDRLLLHFGSLLWRHADQRHRGACFVLIGYDPESAEGAAVRVGVWRAGQWKAAPGRAFAPLQQHPQP